MTQTTQSGPHPDAETLTAFAEQMLSDAEREPVLAHMAVCGRCREVVFLATEAMEEHQLVPSRMPEAPQKKVAEGWLTAWRWSWIPIAALAGVVGVAVLRHNRHANPVQQQMAQNMSPPAAMGNEPRMQDSVESSKRSKSSAKRKEDVNKRGEQDEKESARVLDRKDQVIAQKEADQYAKDTDLPGAFASGAAVQGPSKPSSAPNPEPQNQILANHTETRQQGSSAGGRDSEGSTDKASNRPYQAKMRVAQASESVSANAALASSSAVPSSAPQLASDSLQLTKSNTKLAKAAKFILPSGLGVLSEASEGPKRIALDSAGSLFFSEDGGKHWLAVKASWTGRAIAVRTQPAAAEISENALTRAFPVFELSTDDSQKWISVDGQHWSLESQREK